MNGTTLNSSQPPVTRFAFILGTITAFGPLSIDLYLPSLPSIAKEFQADMGAVQLTLAVYLVGMMAGQSFYGPIADRFGRKRPMLFGCTLYLLASIGCAMSSSIWHLSVLRFVQAIGGCAASVIPSSVVRDTFDPKESARMYSMLMLVMGLAPITAPLIGGQLLMFFGWRALFWFLSCFGLLCLALVTFWLPETLPIERRDRTSLGPTLAVYKRLLSDRRFVGYALTGGCVSAAMFAYIAGSPFVFIDLYGIKPQNYGWIFGTNAFGLIAAAQVNRRLLKRYQGDTILKTMLPVIALSGVLLAIIASSGKFGLPGLLLPIFVCVAGAGFIFPNSAAAAMAPYGGVAGRASAMLGSLGFAVGASSGILVGVLQNGTAVPMAGVMALCCLAALTAFRTMATRPSRQIAAQPSMKSSEQL